MGSIASATSSLAGASSGLTYFNGLSAEAQDLNNSITRAVGLASLPIELLQNTVNSLTSQSNELQKLNSDVQAVQSAITSLATSAANTITARISTASVAVLSASSAALAGSYSLEVTDLGSYSNALSLDGLPAVSDPGTQSISNSSLYTLTVNGMAMQLDIGSASHSLNGLAQAINAADAGVQATVVNVGSDTAADYRLSLQSDQYGDFSMQLSAGGQDLVEGMGDPGQSVQYTLNGKSIESGSRTVTLAAGLTAQLTAANAGNAATVTVANDSTGIANALQSFVSAYNAAMAELGQNRGPGGGALTGQSIIYELSNTLRGIISYTDTGGQISSLAALGVSFSDSSGGLSFDRSTFATASGGSLDTLQQFLGSLTGGGFLKAASDVLTNIDDPISGSLSSSIDAVKSSITATNQHISDQQAQVALLQQNLTRQMAAADALIYSLEQQASYFQQMFQAQRAAQSAGLA